MMFLAAALIVLFFALAPFAVAFVVAMPTALATINAEAAYAEAFEADSGMTWEALEIELTAPVAALNVAVIEAAAAVAFESAIAVLAPQHAKVTTIGAHSFAAAVDAYSAELLSARTAAESERRERARCDAAIGFIVRHGTKSYVAA